MGDPTNPASVSADLDAQQFAANNFMATVVAVGLGAGNSVRIKRWNALRPDTQAYPILASYATPAISDVVYVVAVGSSFLVVGKRLT